MVLLSAWFSHSTVSHSLFNIKSSRVILFCVWEEKNASYSFSFLTENFSSNFSFLQMEMLTISLGLSTLLRKMGAQTYRLRGILSGLVQSLWGLRIWQIIFVRYSIYKDRLMLKMHSLFSPASWEEKNIFFFYYLTENFVTCVLRLRTEILSLALS